MYPWAFQRTYALPDPFTFILLTYIVIHQNFDRAWEGLGEHLGGPNLVGYLLMGTHNHGIKCSLVRPNLQNRAHPNTQLVAFKSTTIMAFTTAFVAYLGENMHKACQSNKSY